MTDYTYQVIRDCGYGRVWTRLAIDHDDAIATVEGWKREGRTDAFINGGDYFIRPVDERSNDSGGLFYDPAGPCVAA